MVQGSGSGYGIHLDSVSGVMLCDLHVDGFEVCIMGDGTSDSKITDNTISYSGNDGIAIIGGSDNRITQNTILNSGDDAIHIESSSDNRICDNFIDTTGLVGGSEEPIGDIFSDGIYLYESTGNTIADNHVINHLEDGIYLVESNDNKVTDNTLLDGESGVVIEISSSNNFVADNYIDNMALFGVGLYMDCNGNMIKDNSISNIAQLAIMIQVESHNNLVKGNTVTNALGGIWIYSDSSGNMVSDNSVSGCAWEGVRMRYSGGNTISGNMIEGNTRGMLIWFNPDDSGNLIIGNTFKENNFGTIFSFGTFENIAYHNNYMDNGVQAIDNGVSNSWDDGSEGNYWSDYKGKDKDHDGCGDTPYSIPGAAGSMDNFPLMHKHK